MDINLNGKRVLITGGTRGIGRAIAVAFAQAGADLAVNYHANDEAAGETERLVAPTGRKLLLLKSDASEVAAGKALVADAVAGLGGIDILVNNAGISHNTPFLALEPEEWNQAVGVNINALFTVTRPFLKHVLGRKAPGKILNVTSLCGVRPVAAVPVHYAMTKAAVVGFTYTLAKEVGRYGVTVNCIAPGLIETAFSVNLPEIRKEDFRRFCPLGRIGTPEEVAHMALFMVSDFNSYMTGETVVVGGGL